MRLPRSNSYTTNIWAEYILQCTLVLFFWDFKDTNAKMYYFTGPWLFFFFFQYFVLSFRSDNFCCFIFKFTDFFVISILLWSPLSEFYLDYYIFTIQYLGMDQTANHESAFWGVWAVLGLHCWVGFSPVAAIRTALWLPCATSHCGGIFCCNSGALGRLDFRRCTGSIVLVHGLSYLTACGSFLDQGSNLGLLHWHACMHAK